MSKKNPQWGQVLVSAIYLFLIMLNEKQKKAPTKTEFHFNQSDMELKDRSLTDKEYQQEHPRLVRERRKKVCFENNSNVL